MMCMKPALYLILTLVSCSFLQGCITPEPTGEEEARETAQDPRQQALQDLDEMEEKWRSQAIRSYTMEQTFHLSSVRVQMGNHSVDVSKPVSLSVRDEQLQSATDVETQQPLRDDSGASVDVQDINAHFLTIEESFEKARWVINTQGSYELVYHPLYGFPQRIVREELHENSGGEIYLLIEHFEPEDGN